MQQKDLQPQGPQGLAPRKVFMMNERSARAMLGVSPSATTGQVKRAYRRLALELHPDRGGDPAAFQQLVVAQQLLLSMPRSVSAPPSPWIDATVPARPGPQRVAPPARPASSARRPPRQTPPRRFGDVLAEKLAAA